MNITPRSGAFHATSGYGLDELRVEPWTPSAGEAALLTQAFTRREPVLVTDITLQMPDLGMRLSKPSSLLLPLAHGEDRLGVLTIGFSTHRT